MNSKLKAPGTRPLKPKYDVLLSRCAFNFNLRRYTQAQYTTRGTVCMAATPNFDVANLFGHKVGRYMLTLCNPS
jgi:hypothetical protein